MFSQALDVDLFLSVATGSVQPLGRFNCWVDSTAGSVQLLGQVQLSRI